MGYTGYLSPITPTISATGSPTSIKGSSSRLLFFRCSTAIEHTSLLLTYLLPTFAPKFIIRVRTHRLSRRSHTSYLKYEVSYESYERLEDLDEVLPSSYIEYQDEVPTSSQQRIIGKAKLCLRQRRSSVFVRGEVLSSSRAKFCLRQWRSSEAKFCLRHIYTGYQLWTDEVLFVDTSLDNSGSL